MLMPLFQCSENWRVEDSTQSRGVDSRHRHVARLLPHKEQGGRSGRTARRALRGLDPSATSQRLVERESERRQGHGGRRSGRGSSRCLPRNFHGIKRNRVTMRLTKKDSTFTALTLLLIVHGILRRVYSLSPVRISICSKIVYDNAPPAVVLLLPRKAAGAAIIMGNFCGFRPYFST
jgi:hypothetical protein